MDLSHKPEKLGYELKLFSGAIATGGRLIVQGFLTQSLSPQVFHAGLLPGLGLQLVCMAIAVLICVVRPDPGGQRRTFPFPQMLRALIVQIPVSSSLT